jgi:hypothetical protein
MSCHLCRQDAKLQLSHIYPKFVVHWIKDTSPTGGLRLLTDINKRLQDGPKEYLFCFDCEQILSADEKQFSEKVFVPYSTAVDSNNFDNVFEEEYVGNFLLKFIIGMQFRTILACESNMSSLSSRDKEEILRYKEMWRNFLLDVRADTGDCETHMFLFCSTEGSSGDLAALGPGINNYLLRSMDCTIVDSKAGNLLMVYNKIGPIGFLTTIKPRRLKKLVNTKIKMKKNNLSCAQKILNTDITSFIYVNRPKQIQAHTEPLSEEQNSKIEYRYSRNEVKAAGSLGERARKLDSDIENKKNKN